MSSTRGYHLMVDLISEKRLGKEELLEIAKRLAELTEMEYILGPLAVEGNPGNEGWSVIGVVDYSTISIHQFDRDNAVLIDVFTCKPFELQKVLQYLRSIPHKKFRWFYLERGFLP